MQHDHGPHSVWLLPEAGTAQKLRASSEGHHGPAFAPHVTLLGDLEGCIATTTACCEAACRHSGAIEATVLAVRRSKDFFTSLYLELSFGENPLRLRRRIQQNIAPDDLREFTPHISLAYGLSTEHELDATSQDNMDVFLGTQIRFDHVAVTNSAKAVAIEEWRVLSSISL